MKFSIIVISLFSSLGVLASSTNYKCRNMSSDAKAELKIVKRFGEFRKFEIVTNDGTENVYEASTLEETRSIPVLDPRIVSKYELSSKDVSYTKSLSCQVMSIGGMFSTDDLLYISDSLLDNEASGVVMVRTGTKTGPIFNDSKFDYEFYKCQN